MINTNEIFDAIFPEGERKPDSDQFCAIMKTDNAVVSAGAGSGKTEVLTTRYAYLLMTNPNLHVKNILAITFTKKAAAEIYARVFKKLNQFYSFLSDKKYGEKFFGEGKPATLLKRAISEFSDAKIQTLDSYSGDIVRLASNVYGIRPDFQIASSSAEKDALPFVLKYKDDPNYSSAYQTFCKVGKIEDFAKNYFASPVIRYTSIATEKNFFQNHLKIQAEKIVVIWNNLIFGDKNGDDDSNSAVQNWNELKSNFSQWKSDIENGKKLSCQPFFETLEIIASENPDFPKIEDVSVLLDEKKRHKKLYELEQFSDFLNLFSKIKMPGGKITNENIIALKKSVNFFRRQSNTKACPFDFLQSCITFVKNFDAISQMYELLDLFLDKVNQNKRISGNLSFKDVSDLALKILIENKEVRNQQKMQVKKIMIDEFQDNNAKNRDMLYLVAEKNEIFTELKDGELQENFINRLKDNISPDKLFFVGDEKQSIYKFRGADVSVFNGLKNTLKGTSGNVEDSQITMTNNYRSNEELLKSFNLLFGDDKTKTSDDSNFTLPSVFYSDNYLNLPEYEAVYLFNADKKKSNFATKPDENGNDIVAPIQLDKENVRIHACILNSGKNKDGTNFSDYKKENICLTENESAGFFIAKTIFDLHNAGKKFNEFAVLDNSRTHRADIQKFLTKFGIPYNVDVQKNIFSEGIANDFYNFLRICVYPTDTNAFASFLASPFVGMSEQGIQSVMSVVNSCDEKISVAENSEDDFTENPKFSAFSNNFTSEMFSLSVDDKEKYENAKKLYFDEQKSILSSSITRTIEKLWYDLGYFFETEGDENLKMYAEQFDLLYQIALEAENSDKNIAWFVDQLALTKQAENSFNVDADSELDTQDVHYPLEKKDAVTIMTIHQSKGLEFDIVFVTGIFDHPKAERQAETFFDEKTGVSLKANDGSQNYFFLEQVEDSKNKELAEQKRKIYVAITRAKHEAYLVGALSEPSKSSKSSNPSLMHRILRYYYNSENGLYQDNNYDFPDKEKTLFTAKIAEPPYYNQTENAPFDFIKINPVSSALGNVEKNKNALVERQKYLESLRNHFDGKPIEEHEAEKRNINCEISLSPSDLEKLEHHAIPELYKKLEDIEQNPLYQKIGDFISKFSSEDEKDTPESAGLMPFTSGSFGTMVHSYLEYWVKNGNLQNVESPENFDNKLLRILDENFGTNNSRRTLSEICVAMTENFASSELGKQVLSAKKDGRIVKAESKFKMQVEKTTISGSIDLFFENADGSFTIVDYKTNNIGKLNPEQYIEQQACYRLALSKIYGIDIAKIKTVLYYLRFGKVIDISQYTIMEKLYNFHFTRV